MMKRGINIAWVVIIVLASCHDNDVNVFDKTADERVAEAIQNLKQELIAPTNGWKIKYKPEAESGSYYVLMKFTDNNKVTIKTDLSSENGKYFEQTISYRIDNSLGLELVLENYCFFSLLFEQNNATFEAEFEFNYVNKTPDNALVFVSKTDVSNPTRLVFQEASAPDLSSVLSQTSSANLNTINSTIEKYSNALKLTYDNKDLVFYFSIEDIARTVTIRSASKKTNPLDFQLITYTSPFVLKNDSLVFESPLKGTFLGNTIVLKGIKLNTLIDKQITPCADPIAIKVYNGVTSQNDKVTLEATLFNHDEELFKDQAEIYYGELYYIQDENGDNVSEQVKADITGAEAMLIYNTNTSTDTFNAIGFFIVNADGTNTIAVREHTPTFVGNQVSFAFNPTITVFRNTSTPANINNIDIYLDKMTEGGKTYISKINDNFYEVYNACNGWRFAFQVIN